MDVLLSVVIDSNFVECARVEGRPVVFHCVPGAGKSTLIRKLLNLDSRFYAITFGKEDSPNLSGKYIRKACSPSEIPEKKLLLVDEYNCGDISRYQPFAVFGDPLQKIGVTLQANFINHRSERFGKNTCKLLRDLGFEVHSDREDCVEVKEIIGGEPEGFVVAIEPEAVQIVIDSGYECYCVEELRGITAEVVTFVAASNTPPVKFREAIFVALTRHRSKLLILAPDAYYGPAQLQ